MFSVKYNEKNEVMPKARLVARGDRNRNSYEAEQTHSPVVTPVTVRWVLSMIHTKKLIGRQLDVKTAFLYGFAKEDIYIEFPDRLNCKDLDKILTLNRVLYGLKTASKYWNSRLVSELRTIGFKQSSTDSCLFYLKDTDDFALIIVSVSDMILTANNLQYLESMIQFLQMKFRVKVGNLRNFLGMDINFGDNVMRISQRNYIRRTLKCLGYQDANGIKTPMEANLKIFADPKGVDNTSYRQKIGMLLYPARYTRPDILFPVAFLGRFQTKYIPELNKYVNRILRYLRSMRILR